MTPLRRVLVAASATALLAAGGLVAVPAEAAAPALRPIGTPARFTHFAVTVQDTVMDPEYYGYVVKLRVCVRSLPPGATSGRTRISWDPWTVTAGGRSHRPSVQEDPPPDLFPRPYQTEGRFRVGECAIGWLPFWSVKLGEQVTSINYANSLGNRARWRSEPDRLGTKATFRHFSVRVNAVERNGDWMAVLATTCVRSVPEGRRSVRVSWDPWRLRTARGVVRPAMDRDTLWSDHYRRQVWLAKGQCVTGWLPFDRTRREVRSVRYSNSLGDQASWRI